MSKKFKGGVEEAAKMIQLLPAAQGRKLIEEIRLKNPKMAEVLEAKLITMDDLQYLTETMLISFLRDVDLGELGLALRGVSPAVVQSILGRVSRGIELDIKETLEGGPKSLSKVEEAQANILKVVRLKVELGHIVIDKDSSETYV